MADQDERSAGPDKREMRRRVSAALRATTTQERSAWSASIVARLETLDRVKAAGVLMGFLPLATEPDVSPLLRRHLERGGRLVLARVDWGTGRMEAAEVRDVDLDVTPGRHGLREPREDLPAVSAGVIDAVLVPGVAFDVQGGRLGRGGGFYDRFLGQPGMRGARVGVCFEIQIVERVTREAHDATMDKVVTERRSLRV